VSPDNAWERTVKHRAIAIGTISEQESLAIERVLSHWVERWDRESPLLFGFELPEMTAVASNWRAIARNDEERALHAARGALRELLHGASAVPGASVASVAGITYEDAAALLTKLGNQT
jgi:hypothetical protein